MRDIPLTVSALHWVLLFLLLAGLAEQRVAYAQACPTSTLNFASGASWEFCSVADTDAGWILRDVAYRAPGDSMRPVLKSLQVSQILLHPHDQSTPQAMVGTSTVSNGLGDDALVVFDQNNCTGERLPIGEWVDRLCSVQRTTGLLARFADRRGIQGNAFDMFTVSVVGNWTLTQHITLHEDGRIQPTLALAGVQSTRGTDSDFGSDLTGDGLYQYGAVVLGTWRIEPQLDSPAADQIEEFDFPIAAGSRRPMQVRSITTESLRNVSREDFRGWRMVDVSGRGYYLDPQTNSFDYVSPTINWAGFDIGFSAAKDCERLALNNHAANCGQHLDDFINGDNLTDQHPVVWYSLTRAYRPRREDLPLISTMNVGFELLPFDWTDRSPFKTPDMLAR